MPTAVVEDYLTHIYWMSRNGQRVIGARLAERMHTAVPTVTETLKRMRREGLIEQDAHKEIQLTLDGQHAAESLLRRHGLSERLLTDILGLSWVDAHAEAHKFEHILSPKVEARIMALLGNPNTCPHGNPIPGGSDGSTALAGTPLSAVNDAGRYRIVRVSEDAESDLELMGYIESQRLKPGSSVTLVERGPFDAPPTIEIDGERVALGERVARVLHVVPEPVAQAAIR